MRTVMSVYLESWVVEVIHLMWTELRLCQNRTTTPCIRRNGNVPAMQKPRGRALAVQKKAPPKNKVGNETLSLLILMMHI